VVAEIVQRTDMAVEEECFVQVIKTHLKTMIAATAADGVYAMYTYEALGLWMRCT